MLTKFVEYCNSFVTILLSALLSRDCSALVSTPVSKMVEYLKFFLLCTLFALLYYQYIRTKGYRGLLKMAEDSLVSFDFDAPQPDSKRQKLLECILTRNSKLYLGKVYTEERVNELSNEEVDKLFNNYEAK